MNKKPVITKCINIFKIISFSIIAITFLYVMYDKTHALFIISALVLSIVMLVLYFNFDKQKDTILIVDVVTLVYIIVILLNISYTKVNNLNYVDKAEHYKEALVDVYKSRNYYINTIKYKNYLKELYKNSENEDYLEIINAEYMSNKKFDDISSKYIKLIADLGTVDITKNHSKDYLEKVFIIKMHESKINSDLRLLLNKVGLSLWQRPNTIHLKDDLSLNFSEYNIRVDIVFYKHLFAFLFLYIIFTILNYIANYKEDE